MISKKTLYLINITQLRIYNLIKLIKTMFCFRISCNLKKYFSLLLALSWWLYADDVAVFIVTRSFISMSSLLFTEEWNSKKESLSTEESSSPKERLLTKISNSITWVVSLKKVYQLKKACHLKFFQMKKSIQLKKSYNWMNVFFKKDEHLKWKYPYSLDFNLRLLVRNMSDYAAIESVQYCMSKYDLEFYDPTTLRALSGAIIVYELYFTWNNL